MNSLVSNDTRETVRAEKFSNIWANELNTVFADIAPHYDIANYVASMGLWGWFRKGFMKTINVYPNERVLDVCAGTNAIGIALLERESTIEVHAIDRSVEMQEIGAQNAQSRGFHIHVIIGDVHTLPFPDNHFDIVTLQFASRHLRVGQVFTEILRVLKPGGRFHHCDMLRPTGRIVSTVYYSYIRFMLWFTASIFRSGEAARNCQDYFVHALQTFYSVSELSSILKELGYTHVAEKSIFHGTLGFHCAVKPPLSEQC